MLNRLAGRRFPASSDDEIIAQIGSSRVALRLPFGHRRADAVIAGVTAKSSAPYMPGSAAHTAAIELTTRAAVASAPGTGLPARARSTITDGVPSTVIRVS